MNAFFYSNEVKEALAAGSAVVALESTIISHGMPYPQNLHTAKLVEQVVRANGATPATIAVLKGRVCIGLNDDQLEQLARAGTACTKVSRRDVAHVVAAKIDGATTVSATMLLAHRAGIKVFVTGGIGGVHRGAQQTFDVSADLTELGRTPVAVVCAGAKSILDIGLTLENLETNGVTVIGFGVDEMPAFFTRRSGFAAPLRLNSAAECAKLIHANRELQLNSGVLVCVPIPEQFEANGARIETNIQQALRDADSSKVAGRDLTPFLLKRVNELTGGESLAANVQLVLNNAKVGAEIARHLASQTVALATPRCVVAVGGTVCDIVGRSSHALIRRDSNIGRVAVQPGGVARNIAQSVAAAVSSAVSVRLISVVGNDVFGSFVRSATERAGVNVDDVLVADSSRTAIYDALLDDGGDLDYAVADMSINDTVTSAHIIARLVRRGGVCLQRRNV
jgi:pseudouridine-5'-phosphate glycosidase